MGHFSLDHELLVWVYDFLRGRGLHPVVNSVTSADSNDFPRTYISLLSPSGHYLEIFLFVADASVSIRHFGAVVEMFGDGAMYSVGGLLCRCGECCKLFSRPYLMSNVSDRTITVELMVPDALELVWGVCNGSF